MTKIRMRGITEISAKIKANGQIGVSLELPAALPIILEKSIG